MPKPFFSLAILLSLSFWPFGQRPAQSPAAAILQHYQENWTSFEAATTHYLAVSKASESSAEAILEAHLQTRLAYKKLEYLLAYYDEDAVKDFFNGAPLPVIRQIGREIKVLDPEGLQVLDELVVEAEMDHFQIQFLVERLADRIADMQDFETQRYLNEPYILDAMCQQVVRMMTLGITGFDTPGTLAAVPEAKVSLEAMAQDFASFESVCTPASQNAYHQTIQAFREAASLFTTDFESLDRMSLIRNHLNPLYRNLRRFHQQMGYPQHSALTAREQSINDQAETPFSTDFLNSYYFTYQAGHQESEAQVELGRFLFYEPAMSADASMSCASCHQPNKAFTDGLTKSLDNQGEPVLRNAPTLLNAVFAQRHFYDLRADKLENQLADVFHNEREFQSDFAQLSERLQQSEEYVRLFETAYPGVPSDRLINHHHIVSAMTAYVRTLQSFDSPFDRYVRAESNELDPLAVEGFNLFMGKAACGTCHFAPTFSGLVPPDYHENESEVLGVPADKAASQLDPDLGRIMNGRYHEQAEHLRHSFKTVGIRNVALTGPYMHNGVFETLSEVVDFYNRGGGAGMGLEVPYQTLGADPLALTEREQTAIVRFMESLTDTVGTTAYPKHLPAFDEGSAWSRLPRKLEY